MCATFFSFVVVFASHSYVCSFSNAVGSRHFSLQCSACIWLFYCQFVMLSGMGLDPPQHRPIFQNSVQTPPILEPLMCGIIKFVDCSRNLFSPASAEMAFTKMMCENEMLMLALPKVNVSENSLAIKASFCFSFCRFFF